MTKNFRNNISFNATFGQREDLPCSNSPRKAFFKKGLTAELRAKGLHIAAWLAVTFLLSTFCTAQAHAKENEKDWQKYSRNHFIIYYKEAPLDFVKTVHEAAERYYKEIAKNLGFTRFESWSWDERAKIYIYDDAEDYQMNAGTYKWSHGAASPSQKIIRTFPSAHGFFDSTLPHELGHIIFREFIGFKARVPLWLEEGVAMYQEKAKRWGADKAVKAAMENETFIPLKNLTYHRLSKADQATVQLFYAESASVVYYMITELGKQRFVRLCRKLQQGKIFDNALHLGYARFKNQDDLNKSWVKYLK